MQLRLLFALALLALSCSAYNVQPRLVARSASRFASSVRMQSEEDALAALGVTAAPEPEVTSETADAEGMSEEEYLAQLAVEESTPQQLSADAKKVYNNMRSESGVEFAPWMQIDPEKIAKAEKEREARKNRATSTVDPLGIDPQAAELSGEGGLSSRVISEEEIELKWSTGDETGNVGFMVQRRPGGSQAWTDIAKYTQFAQLRTKGPQGGTYSFLDDTVPDTGTWVYRIVDCDDNGRMSGICQKLVEVESKGEQQAQLFVGAAIAGLALVLIIAGTFLDPIQTTDKGASFF